MSRLNTCRLVAAAGAAVLLAGVGLIAAQPAFAAAQTRYVATDGEDAGECTQAAPCKTIQYAVDQAQPGDTISIASGTYDESVDVRISLTLLGAGATGSGKTTVDGAAGSGPSILVDGIDTGTPPEVTIENLDVSGNQSDDGIDVVNSSAHIIDCVVSSNNYNGISVEGTGTVTVAGTDVSDNLNEGIVLDGARLAVANAAPSGADILPSAAVSGSTVNRNQDGGVIVEQGNADVTETTLDSNTGAGMVLDGPGTQGSLTKSTVSNTVPFTDRGGPAFGGGVLVFPGGSVTVDTSTIDGNTGQGVLSLQGSVTVNNSTITNTAPGASDAQFVLPDGGLAYAATLPGAVANLRAFGLSSLSRSPRAAAPALPELAVSGSIVADNDVPDCAGPVTDNGYNLSGDAANSCAFTAGQHDLVQTDPQLGALADNGGPTLTQLPAADSPALDVIPSGSAGCTSGTTDQRGVARPQPADGLCDVGAVELKASVAPSSSAASSSAAPSSSAVTTSADPSSSSLPSSSSVPESPDNESSTSLANTGAHDVAALTGIGSGAVLLGVLALLGAAYLRRSRGRHSG